jgi:hypothetical protein
MAHTCNPSYSRGKDQEDLGSKPARANSPWDPVSEKTHHTKKGWWTGLRCRPWVQTPVLPPPQKNTKPLLLVTSFQIFLLQYIIIVGWMVTSKKIWPCPNPRNLWIFLIWNKKKAFIEVIKWGGHPKLSGGPWIKGYVSLQEWRTERPHRKKRRQCDHRRWH